MKFSLIIATYNRKNELANCLYSLSLQTYKNFEVIIVDQTENSTLKDLCDYYREKYFLDIKYFYSKRRGGSIARNIGINFAEGDILTFPDDDCEYYPETLNEVNDFFKKNKNVDALLGKIEDKNGKNIIREWPQAEKIIKKSNFFLLYSAITLFVRNSQDIIKFSEELGSGLKIGAYEDADYMLRLLNLSKNVIYSPKIKLWHPEIDKNNIQKMYSYGLGFGYFCRKNLSIYTIYLFLLVLTYHLIKLLKGIFKFDKKLMKQGYYSFISRIIGFLKR